LETVAAGFATAPPEVVCLQGVLDYYNPETNWIARCFTIEYAAWFRVILPGLARMGLPVPLGGTTLFMRRAAVEELGGWDAHNVTEDADLGIRISRFGYRTELIPTVTHEEANCQPRAWVKQRSRWLKGYMVTWLVHMRTPISLLRDVGIWHFLGMQLIFACTLSQFLLAPLIWLFWAGVFGMPLLSENLAPPGTPLLFFVFGVINAMIFIRAVARRGNARLFPWVFTLGAYFPLATLAAYKALYELITNPFYWDKTAHGKTHEATAHALPEDLAPIPAIPGEAV
ncbi:MAG: glycosyltransferase, partial [Rhodobacteraceae bacterium]|nr:glycosyltransferase [Paracoccaceae bacterium]